MQDGLKAGLAILIAFILTGFAGFLTTVSPVDVVKTSYDRVADLTPSVVATDIDSYDTYSPATNVTGWSGDADVIESKSSSPYLLSTYIGGEEQTALRYIMFPDSNVNNGLGGSNYPTSYSIDNHGWYINMKDNVIFQHGSTDSINGRAYNGGVTFSKTVSGSNITTKWVFTNNVSIDGTYMNTTSSTSTASSENAWYFIPISTFIDEENDATLLSGESSLTTLTNGTTINLNISDDYTFYYCVDGTEWVYTYNDTGASTSNRTFTYTATSTANFVTMGGEDGTEYLTYVEDTQLWYPTKLDGEGNLTYNPDTSYSGYSSDNIYIVVSGSGTSYATDGISVNAFTPVYEYSYADPTKFVIIGNHTLDDDTKLKSSSDNPYNTVDCSPTTASALTPLYVAVGAEVSIVGDGYSAEISSAGDDIGLDTATGGVSGTITDTGETVIKFTKGSVTFNVTVYAVEDTSDGIGYWTNTSSGTEYQNGYISFLTETGTTISTDDAYWKDSAGNVTQGSISVTIPSDIPYDLVLVTLDFVNQEFYAQGVTPLKGLDVADTVNYTLADYKYPLKLNSGEISEYQVEFLGEFFEIAGTSETIEYEYGVTVNFDIECSLVNGISCIIGYYDNDTDAVLYELDCKGHYDGATYTFSYRDTEISVDMTSSNRFTATGTIYNIFGYYFKMDFYFWNTEGADYEDNVGTFNYTFVHQNTEPPTYITSLSFYKDGGTRAFIKETWVQLDPMNLLWGDPYLYLYYFYPNLFTTSGDDIIPEGEGLRVLFNGFVAYGDSLTINGVEITVNKDNTGTFTVGDVERTIYLKGMAVDFYDGHVYLVDTEHKKATYDLGEYNQNTQSVIRNGVATGSYDRVAYTIMGEGAWYWYANIYDIVVTETTEMQIDLSKGLAGWEMSLQVTVLLFIGMLILSVAGVVYMFRDTEPFSFLDWFIIGMAIVILFSVMSL